MDQQITKVGDKYEVWSVTQTFDIKEMKDKILQLQNELKEPEPTDAELIECGKATHPYYMQQEENSQIIEQIQSKIDELKTISITKL